MSAEAFSRLLARWPARLPMPDLRGGLDEPSSKIVRAASPNTPGRPGFPWRRFDHAPGLQVEWAESGTLLKPARLYVAAAFSHVMVNPMRD